MVDMMLDEGNLNEIINDSARNKTNMSETAVTFQRDVMEHNFQIERNFGCRYLARVPELHPNDTELIEAMKKFMFTALQSFVKALNQRSRRYKNGTLTPPNPTQTMSRQSILEFLEGCNALSKFIA